MMHSSTSSCLRTSLAGPCLKPRALLRHKAGAAATRTTNARRATLQVKAAIAMPAAPQPSTSPDHAMWGPDAPEHVAEWRRNLDLKAFGAEMRKLERDLRANQGEEDVKHLRGVLTSANVCYFVGLALAPFCDVMSGNIFAALLMSTAIFARWTMVGHHVSHGGYNSQQNGKRFHRSTFGKGPLHRALDWLDWMLPEAWDVEHNNLHHYKLGETNGDPDLVERNADAMIRSAPTPTFFKYMQVGILMFTWKWYYYMPNTLKSMYQFNIDRDAARAGEGAEIKQNPFEKMTFKQAGLLAKCAAPFFLVHFVAIPAPFFVFGGQAMGMMVLANMIVAEILTNFHSFLAIATNHCGDDVYRFDTEVKPKTDEFYLRAIIGSVNYPTAHMWPKPEGKPAGILGNVNDFVHGWLNYQIEHHMFPDLSMLSYQKAMPIVKDACKRYGIPYVQQDMLKRLNQTTKVMVGRSDMLKWERGD